MCTLLRKLFAEHPEAVRAAAADPDTTSADTTAGPRRRTALLGAAGGAALSGIAAAPSASAQPQGRGRPRRRTELVMLGTAGGPSVSDVDRMGISTMVVYNGKGYVVDLGHGSHLSLARCGLSPSGQMLANVRGIFFTHLHPTTSPSGPRSM